MKSKTLRIVAPAFFGCAALASAFVAPTKAWARSFDNKIVSIVHTGEAGVGNGNVGSQCYFQIVGNYNWFRIPQSAAGKTNCSVVLTAFLSGKSISFDQTSSNVQYLCMANGTSC